MGRCRDCTEEPHGADVNAIAESFLVGAAFEATYNGRSTYAQRLALSAFYVFVAERYGEVT